MDAVGVLRHGDKAHRDWASVRFAGGIVATVVLTGTAAVVAAVSVPTAPEMTGLLRASMVAAPMTAGLAALRLPYFERFARLLLLVGVVSFATTLAESADPALYTIGRTAGWGLELLLVYVLLAFPTGQVTERPDRIIVGAMAAAFAVFYLPTLVLAPDFPVPSPYTSCTSDCPAGVLSVLDHAPWVVDPLMRGAGSVATFLVMVAVVLRLQTRLRRATTAWRMVLAPVLVVGVTRTAFVGAGVVARAANDGFELLHACALVIAVATAGISLAFLLGLLRARLFAERALVDLAETLRGQPDAGTLHRSLVAIFRDPTIDIVFPAGRAGDGWMDIQGRPVPEPKAGAGRSVSFVPDDHGAVAAVVCDEALLAMRPGLLDACASMAAVVFQNRRLGTAAEATAGELRRSRARIVASADRERRRIERDLHDGAQQRLVALRIELGLLEGAVERDSPASAARVRDLETAVEDALEDLRSLAHGVCPPLLADRGLADALQAAAARCPVPVTCDLRFVGPLPGAHRERRVLLRSRGAPERRQAREARAAHRGDARRERPRGAALRRARRRRGRVSGRAGRRGRAPQHAGSHRGDRRRAARDVHAGRRHRCARKRPDPQARGERAGQPVASDRPWSRQRSRSTAAQRSCLRT